jgi:hypothetical protein
LGQARRRKERRAKDYLLLGAVGGRVYMLYAYSKNEQGDLTLTQARKLGQLVRKEFK